MKQFLKRLTALMLPLALCVSLLGGCARDGEGMTLAVCTGSAPDSLDPAYAEDVTGQTIIAHLYENLMRVTADSSGKTSVINGMAKSVDQEEETRDGAVTVTYTFRLRSARWSDGQAVRANDFVYAWRRLANPATGSRYADLLSVVSGFQEARAAGDMSLLQVTAKNDATLVVVLNGHYDWFLKEVCTSPATMPLREDVVQRLKAASGSKSWWEADPTQLVTNGPYTLAAQEGSRFITLEANSRYYNSSQPGPEGVEFHFAKSAEETWSLYESKAVDAAWPLPDQRLELMASDPEWTPLPELSTYTALFNCNSEFFSDPALREAMSLAVDRNAIVEAAGSAALAAEGVVPPGVPENDEGDFRTLSNTLLSNDPEGYEDRCKTAQALLNEAGYNGSDLGELEFLYLQGDENTTVAEVLCQQWREVLGVQVTPKGMTERNLMSVLRAGEYDLAGLNLSASANDAECFLMSWTAGGRDNFVAYESTAYDTLMKIIASSADGTARMGCLHDAEALLLMNNAMIPLYTTGTAWELRETYTGAFRDPRGWFSFAGVVNKT